MSCIQKVEWTKPVFEQTLSTDQPLYWALLNVPVLICLNIFFLRLKMMMWRTWWNMQHQVNLPYGVFLWKVIFFNHKMFRKSLVSLVSFFMECWTVLCPPKPWPRLHICKTLIFKRFVKEFQLTSSVTYYWTNTQQYGI